MPWLPSSRRLARSTPSRRTAASAPSRPSDRQTVDETVGHPRAGGRLSLFTGRSMVWDPYSTLKQALWIGGAQWAGKSTVAYLLATRYGLTAYHYDYQDARAHDDRRLARRVRLGEPLETPFNEAYWQNTPAREMAAIALAGFPIRFEWVLDDLRALTSGRPIVAEGWGLRPELVMPIVDSPRRMVVMIPT